MHPLEVLEKLKTENEIYDSRLSKHGNRLLKSIEILIMQQHIFIGQYKHHHTVKLGETEISILNPKLKRLLEKSKTIVLLLNNKKEKNER